MDHIMRRSMRKEKRVISRRSIEKIDDRDAGRMKR